MHARPTPGPPACLRPAISLPHLFHSYFSSFSQREIKGGAALQRSLRPDAAAMAMDDPLHNGQSNAGSFEFIGAMQPLEHAKEFVCVLHVKSGSVVAHEV